MTQQEILDFNRRCAEFLGVTLHESQLTMPHPHFTGYHSDWSWLMEVVDKIEIKYSTVIACSAYIKREKHAMNIHISESLIIGGIGASKREAVISAIDKFLIWYEQNK